MYFKITNSEGIIIRYHFLKIGYITILIKQIGAETNKKCTSIHNRNRILLNLS